MCSAYYIFIIAKFALFYKFYFLLTNNSYSWLSLVNTIGEGVFQIGHLRWQPTLEMMCEQLRCLAKTVSGDSTLLVFFP